MKKESNDKEKKDDNADGDDDESDDLFDNIFNEKNDDDDAVKLKVENTTTKQSEAGMNNQRNDYHQGDSNKNDVRKTSSLDDRKELTGRYDNPGANNQNANQGTN